MVGGALKYRETIRQVEIMEIIVRIPYKHVDKCVPASQTNPCNIASYLEESPHEIRRDTAGSKH